MVAICRGVEDRPRSRRRGERTFYRFADATVSWVFESATATITPTSTIRLPDASDVVPPTLARSVLDGARPDELSRLPNRRVSASTLQVCG